MSEYQCHCAACDSPRYRFNLEVGDRVKCWRRSDGSIGTITKVLSPYSYRVDFANGRYLLLFRGEIQEVLP